MNGNGKYTNEQTFIVHESETNNALVDPATVTNLITTLYCSELVKIIWF